MSGYEAFGEEVPPAEVRAAARSYYETHVTHRAHVFNLMIVFAAAGGVAYATALEAHRGIAEGIAWVTAICMMVLL